LIELKIIDNITIEIKKGVSFVKDCLSYPAEVWIKGPFRKEKKNITKNFVENNKKISYCYTGFINRILEYSKIRNISFSCQGIFEILKPDNPPELKGVVLRDYQIEAIQAALTSQRGIINAATGTGKTTIALGIISCFKNPKVLYLVPTIDLLNQTHKILENHFEKVSKVGNGHKEINSDIVIATIQTFSRLNLDNFSDKFDIVILDEAHLAMGRGSTCEKILKTCLAPIRIAFTATLPVLVEKRLVLEGLIGEVIYDLSVTKALEKKILTPLKIKLLKIPISKTIKDKIKIANSYKNAYNLGIVQNSIRNRVIAQKAKQLSESGKSVLIFTKELEHIKNICECLKALEVPHENVQGSVEGDERERIKNALISKEIKIVVSSVVWVVGIDLVTLDSIIFAGGGMAEIGLLQGIGRALRNSEGKTETLIFDCVDSYRFLAEHFATRMNIYLELDWI